MNLNDEKVFSLIRFLFRWVEDGSCWCWWDPVQAIGARNRNPEKNPEWNQEMRKFLETDSSRITIIFLYLFLIVPKDTKLFRFAVVFLTFYNKLSYFVFSTTMSQQFGRTHWASLFTTTRACTRSWRRSRGESRLTSFSRGLCLILGLALELQYGIYFSFYRVSWSSV